MAAAADRPFSLACAALAACAGVFAWGGRVPHARADGPPAVHAVSDALYVGMQAGPDLAFLVAYDFDVLVSSRSDGISIGPSVSFGFGGQGSAEHGRIQEYLFAADFLRLRATVLQEWGMRVTLLFGAGMYFTSLIDQRTQAHPAELPDGTPVTVTEHFPGQQVPGAMISTGAGFDWYWDHEWGIATYLVTHVRVDEQTRIEPLWIELGVGIRLGR